MRPKQSESLTKSEKKGLEFLVEEFLEKDRVFITEKFENQKEGAQAMVLRLDRLLFKDEFWMDELYEEDHENTDFVKVLSDWHRVLKPLWNQIKKALLNYKEEILPMRGATSKKNYKSVPQKLQGLSPYDPYQMDKYYNINLRSGAISHVTLSFDAGKIDIYDRDYKIKNNFLDLIKGVPISLFGRCKHCENSIVITRKDKEHCSGCAAKRWQKEKWEEDLVKSRKKEKERYQKRKKKRSHQT